MLAIRDLSKRYGETVALDGASETFQRGSIHVVLGENGSGKSTLVKLLSGITVPSRGAVLVDGRPVERYEPRAMLMLGVGTVFQEVLVAPDRSVVDNILLGYDALFRRRLPRAERRDAAASALAQVARTPIDLGARAGDLPLAARQLIVLARAIIRQPRILILDEVTAALDFNDRETVFTAMERFAAEGGLILFISHRMDEVMRLAHRVTVLRSGRLVATVERADLEIDALLRLMAPGTARRLQHDA